MSLSLSASSILRLSFALPVVVICLLPAGPVLAQLVFTDVTETAGVGLPQTLNESLAWGDYDNDGDQDLYLTNRGPNKLFRNDGGDTFTDVTDAAGVGADGFSVGCAFGDLDNDGDLDLYIVTFGVEIMNTPPDVLYRNDGPVGLGGEYSFTDVTVDAGISGVADNSSSRGVAFLDYDRDGLLDIYVNAIGPDLLYRNLGDLKFEEVAGALGVATVGQGVGVVATDIDNNGWIDIYTGNRSGDLNRLYLNDGGAFTDITEAAGLTEVGLGMGVHAFDYDNDLDMDLYWTSWPEVPNAFYENVDGQSFTNVAIETKTDDPLGWGISNNAGDIDNDGWEDFFVTNGFSPDTTANVLFRNNGDKTFSDVTDVLGGALFDGRGAAFCDYDQDGDLDLCVTGGPDAETRLWRNDTPTNNHWISFSLTGVESNRSAIGARLEVQTELATYVKEVSGGAGRGSFNSLPVEFGLGEAESVTEVRIRWPNGRMQVLTDLAVDQTVEVVEPAALVFTDVSDVAGITLPETLTESVAWGDYDNDGDEDLYLTNLGPNKLFRNDGGDIFTDVTDIAGVGFETFSVGAAFGDLDNDGDLDLYVVSFQGPADPDPDALYRNDGPVGPDGAYQFTEVAAGSGITDGSSSRGIAFLDYDRDGLLDIYVNAIGPDILYHNLGDLQFENVAGELGVATAGQGVGVVPTDVDNNGWIDIYTGNRSGDLNRLYLNDGGMFTDITEEAGLTEVGLGMGVHAFDYDNDLDMDLYWTSWPEVPNALYENIDGRTFTNVAAETKTDDPLGWGISNNAGDIDNDGWEDFFVTNGFSPGTTANVLFRNNGDKTFSDVTAVLGGALFDGRGAAFCDYDQDGDVDLLVTAGDTALTRLWRNDSDTGHHWVTFLLRGVESNRSAIGARIEVDTEQASYVKEVSGGAGRGSFNSLPVEFGLGTADSISEVRIRWPNGTVQVLTDVAVDQRIEVTEATDPGGDVVFKRGDSNLDDLVDQSDAILTLSVLFLGEEYFRCEDAADANDDGSADISDAIFILMYKFQYGDTMISAPGPDQCGVDPTEDDLGCEEYPQENC